MKMIFRLLAIAFVFVNMAGFAKPIVGELALAALAANAGLKLDVNQ
jgi:hypothetical protein